MVFWMLVALWLWCAFLICAFLWSEFIVWLRVKPAINTYDTADMVFKRALLSGNQETALRALNDMQGALMRMHHGYKLAYGPLWKKKPPTWQYLNDHIGMWIPSIDR